MRILATVFAVLAASAGPAAATLIGIKAHETALAESQNACAYRVQVQPGGEGRGVVDGSYVGAGRGMRASAGPA